MPYKVFFVEDEAVTREGIRDNVDWLGSGFEFCGEAPDGEMALPLLRTALPDVLITDIKMPFMDGLQLSKIMRERMPWVKIIILSGHDEFRYAQQAIKLGVTDYLLKPITVTSLQNVLQKLTVQLDREKKERDELKKLQEQAKENRTIVRERFLFKLVVGAVPPADVIESGRALGFDLSGGAYLAMILKVELNDRSEQYDHGEHQKTLQTLMGLIEKSPNVFTLTRDWGDMVMIMKGDNPESLEKERDSILNELRNEVAKTRYKLNVGAGTIRKRIADISQSFVEALSYVQSPVEYDKPELNQTLEQANLIKLDKSAIENYLHSGTKDEFEKFFNTHLMSFGEIALNVNLIKNYIFVDIVLATTKLINRLGGEVDKVIPNLNSIELAMWNTKSMDQLREEVKKIVCAALTYRDSQPKGQYKEVIRQAKEYMALHYMDTDLSLNSVAVLVNLSTSHFSFVFSQHAGQTFKEYLIELRMNKAKELLRMTSLRSAEIAYQVGYNDPHYFSSVFKKHTGFSPMEFRAQI